MLVGIRVAAITRERVRLEAARYLAAKDRVRRFRYVRASSRIALRTRSAIRRMTSCVVSPGFALCLFAAKDPGQSPAAFPRAFSRARPLHLHLHLYLPLHLHLHLHLLANVGTVSGQNRQTRMTSRLEPTSYPDNIPTLIGTVSGVCPDLLPILSGQVPALVGTF